MNINIRQILAVTTVLLGACCSLAFAQSTYRVTPNRNGNMKLSGTSTLHNWDMNARSFSGAAVFNFAPGIAGKLKSIRALSFSLPVTNLKSDEKKLDENAYKALKSDRFKNILFTLASSSVSPGAGLNKYNVKAAGNLSIAGVTRGVLMNVSCVVNKDETVTCTGSQSLKMSDYGVKPPTFMLGAMKTGNAITLNYTLVYMK